MHGVDGLARIEACSSASRRSAMQTIGGVFDSRAQALRAVQSLHAAGVKDESVVALMPGSDPREFQTEAELLRDHEGPGAWAAIGAGLGSFAGAAFVSAVMPGIGPILGLGALAAAFIAGGIGGKLAGDAVERSSIHDDVGDDLYLFAEALRREKALVVVMIDRRTDPRSVHGILSAAGAKTLDEARAQWWRDRRDEEERHYASLGNGRRFSRAESSYRRGFEAAFDPRYRGRKFESVAVKLRTRFHDEEEEDFRTGFERGTERAWQQQQRKQLEMQARERAERAEPRARTSVTSMP
jgi:hypothetical protein